MSAAETKLQTVQRHVRHWKKLVSRQSEIVTVLALRNHPTDIAVRTLINFKACLEAHEDPLTRSIEK